MTRPELRNPNDEWQMKPENRSANVRLGALSLDFGSRVCFGFLIPDFGFSGGRSALTPSLSHLPGHLIDLHRRGDAFDFGRRLGYASCSQRGIVAQQMLVGR